MVSVVGRDFADYAKHLRRPGLVPRLLVDKESYTATFYGMSDPLREQIGIFQGNAYHKHADNLSLHRLLKKSDWRDIAVGIFAAGTARSIVKQLGEFRRDAPKDALAIFDPGQMLMIDFDESSIARALKFSHILILNDTELSHLRNHFGFTLERIFALGVKYVIETRGADGSSLHEPDKRTDVKTLKVKKVVDPTGAGDAYRAGLIHGLLSGKNMKEAMRLGSRLGSLCVAHLGGQTYKI